MRPSKKETLVKEALRAFQTGGYNATGVDALAAAAGVSKTSIYNHFRTKDELILAALELRHDAVMSAFRQGMDAAGDAASVRILGFFDALALWFAAPDFSGCAFIKAAAEHQSPDDPINQAAQRHKQALETLLRIETERMRAAAPKNLAAQLMTLAEGAIVRRHMNMSPTAAQEAKAAAEALLAGAASEAEKA